jgi:CDP-glucose 4,6-dehydratase
MLGLENEIAHTVGDVRDAGAVRRAFEENRPEIVLHLAAQSLVHASYQDPVATFSTNVMGTVQLLEAARSVPGVRVLLNVTSDKCYENREWTYSYRENDAMGGHDPYSSSKGCSELVTAAYRNSFLAKMQVAVATARAGNVIGGGDWAADRLIPDFVRASRDRSSVQIRNPQAVRPWQHVLEPLHGYLCLAENLWHDGEAYADAWNFGPPAEDVASVEHVVTALVSIWGDGARWDRDSQQHAHEAHLLKLDSSKSRTQLRWRSRLPLPTALQWTVDWYKQQAAGVAARKLCMAQIHRYEELVRS